MQVAVIGIGNVGCALLYPLSYNKGVDSVLVMSRREEAATAAIMDVASANPRGAAKISFSRYERISEADIIVLTAGVQMEKGQSASDVLWPNIEIAEAAIASRPLKKSAIVICLATPVDYLTVHVQKISNLPPNQVFGFGGDLDRNRLEYILRRDGKDATDARIVGEHGANAIPVFRDEADYAAVALGVRKFLFTITSLAGETRNLSTGDQLGKLVHSIVDDTGEIHYVCGFHPVHGVYLTWPFAVRGNGLGVPVDVELEENASNDLNKLVSARKNRIKSM